MGLARREQELTGYQSRTPRRDRHLPAFQRAIVRLRLLKMRVRITYGNTDAHMQTYSQLVIFIWGLEMKARPDLKQTLLRASRDRVLESSGPHYENHGLDLDLNHRYYSVQSCETQILPGSKMLGQEPAPWFPR